VPENWTGNEYQQRGHHSQPVHVCWKGIWGDQWWLLGAHWNLQIQELVLQLWLRQLQLRHLSCRLCASGQHGSPAHTPLRLMMPPAPFCSVYTMLVKVLFYDSNVNVCAVNCCFDLEWSCRMLQKLSQRWISITFYSLSKCLHKSWMNEWIFKANIPIPLSKLCFFNMSKRSPGDIYESLIVVCNGVHGIEFCSLSVFFQRKGNNCFIFRFSFYELYSVRKINFLSQ